MDEARSIDDKIEDMTASAANVIEDADAARESVVEDIVESKASLEAVLADAVASVRQAIVAQPIASVLLVGAFAFLYGLNRRA